MPDGFLTKKLFWTEAFGSTLFRGDSCKEYRLLFMNKMRSHLVRVIFLDKIKCFFTEECGQTRYGNLKEINHGSLTSLS